MPQIKLDDLAQDKGNVDLSNLDIPSTPESLGASGDGSYQGASARSLIPRTAQQVDEGGSALIRGGLGLMLGGGAHVPGMEPTLYQRGVDALTNLAVSPLAKKAGEAGAIADKTTSENLNPEAQKSAARVYATTDPSKAAYLDPARITGDVIQNSPTFIMSMLIPAMRARSLAALGETGLAEAAKQFAAESAVNEGAIGYTQEAGQGRDRAAKATGGDGTDLLSTHAAETAGGIGGAVDAAAEYAGGRVLGKVFTEGGPLYRRLMNGFVSQGATEAVQGAGEQVGENLAVKSEANPKQSLLEGVPENVASSAVVGGLIGGAAGGALGRSHPRAGINPDIETGNATPPTAAEPTPGRLPPLAPGEQGDLFTLDRLLDHGIAPVETSGRSGQVSEKGAAGKYQLLPATARQEANRLGIEFDPEKLKTDDAYAKQLAQSHMEGLIRKYDGDKLLAVTAYNAGEGNVDSWVSRFGYDPANPQPFLQKIAEAGNPRSAAYPLKVAAAMGVTDLNSTHQDASAAPAESARPSALDTDYTQSGVATQLRSALLDAEGQPLPANSLVTRISAKVASSLQAADPQAARDHLASEQAKIEKAVSELAEEQTQLHEAKGEHSATEQAKYQQALDDRLERLIEKAHVIGKAHDVVNRFEAALQQADPKQGDLFQAQPAAAPAPAETPAAPPVETPIAAPVAAPAPAEPKPQAPGDVEAEHHRADDVSAHEVARKAVLDTVLEDKATRDPTRRFVAGLKRLGMDASIRPTEAERIAQHEEDRNTRELPSAPDESDNFGIPEKKPAEAPRPAEATPVAQPAAEPAPAAPERVEGNVRQRALDHAETLGSSRRAWFLKGVDTETGTHEQTPPASKSKATWFEEGRSFVRDEKARQERENAPAETPPPPKIIKKTVADRLKEKHNASVKEKAAPARGGQKAFDSAVAAAEQNGSIGPRDGVALRAAASAAWDQDMWNALDQAVKENGISAKKFAEPRARQGEIIPSLDKVSDGLRTQLDRLGLHDVGVRLASQVEMMMHGGNEGTRGIFETNGVNRLIRIAMADGDPAKTLDHEAVHALRDLELFTDQEWKAMEVYAATTKAGAWAREAYGQLSKEDIREEAVAEAYSDWAKGTTPAKGMAQQAFQKVGKFFQAIARAFNINGFRDAESVFKAIQSGEVGKRTRFADDHSLRPAPPRFRQDTFPEPVKKANVAIARTVANTAKVGHLWVSFTKDIANMAKEFLPSAQKMIDLHSSNHGLARSFEQRLLEVKDAYNALPAPLKGNGKGSVNEFLYDSRMAGKWGFKPDYQPKAVVDTELSQRFNRMPKAVQDVIKSVFRTNYDLRNQLYQETVGAINAEYDPLMDVAKDAAERTSIAADKAKAMATMSRVFDTRDGMPYTPLKRDGQWAVVARSKEYMQAKETGDTKEMDRLRADPAHYFVDFRDTVHEAGALADRVKTAFKDGDTRHFNRGDIPDGQIGGRELYLAFAQLKEAVGAELRSDPTNQKAKALNRLATDLYLHTLSDTSARKGELHAELVSGKDPDGGVIDMMKAFVTRGQASTHYVASISNSAEMQRALRGMREEVSQVEGNKATDAHRFYNELMYRYAKNLTKQPNRVVDKATKAVSLWNLLISPAYHLTNALQNAQLAHPVLAGMVGYDKATSHFMRAYADFAKMTSHISLDQRMDFSRAPEDVRDVIKRLAESGRLDAGLSQDLGHWEINGDGILPSVWNKVDAFTRNLPQRVEVGNRVTAGIAAYRSMMEKTGDAEKAYQTAAKLIDDAHGDYSGFNAPTPFHWGSGTFGKIALQFRKFQLVTASLMVKEFHKAFTKANSTKDERNAARLALAYLSAHTVALGGMVALPGASVFGLAVMAAMKALDADKRDDYTNWKMELQRALGAGDHADGSQNMLADLLFKGAPYALLKADMSGKVGLGDTFSPAPFIDMDKATTSRDDMYAAFGQFISGALGGLAAKGVDAFGYANDGQTGRAFATLLPNGVLAGSAKALLQRNNGLQSKSGDTLVQPEDMSSLDQFYTALGITPADMANVSDRRSETFEATQHYQDMATHMTRQYALAAKADDTDKMSDLRDSWAQMQTSMKDQGFKPTPISSLYKAPGAQFKREAKSIDGVETTKSNREFVDDLVQ